MKLSPTLAQQPTRPLPHLSWRTVLSDLLPPLDVLWFALAAMLESTRGGTLEPPIWVAMVLAPIMLYEPRFGVRVCRAQGHIGPLGEHVLRYAALAVVLWTLAVATRPWGDIDGVLMARWLLVGLVGTTLARLVVARTLLQLQRRGRLDNVVAVIGSGLVAQRLLRSLEGSGGAGSACLTVLGAFDDADRPGFDPMRPGAGTIAQLIELGRTRRIDWIIVARSSDAHDDVQALADRLRGTAAQIALWPGQMGHLATPVAPAAVGQRVLVDVLADRPIRRSNLIVKAAEDRVLGACITLLILPLLALIALAVRLDSPGPILFRQRRHALDNGEFEILKFRTMHQDAGPPGAGLEQTRRGDPRITRVGRWLREFSLDELPQLFNVLAGTMSLVGPRPHAVNMRTENRLGSEIVEDYAHRHRVKPGITGWAQVNGARGATDTSAQLERRVEFDLHYVENWSLWFDLKILAMTGRAVLRRTNAY